MSVVCSLFVVSAFRMLTLPYLVNIAAVSVYGLIFLYSIKVEFLILSQESSSSYMAHRLSLLTHRSRRTNDFLTTQNFFFEKDFYIILASLLLLLLLQRADVDLLFFKLHRSDIFRNHRERYYNEISFTKISSDSEF